MTGPSLGADDYITKSFSLMVLRARIENVLRKFTTSANNIYTDDVYSFDFDIVDRIWTDGTDYVDENALSVTASRLRKKLNDADYIQTVYGIGYMWRTV